MTQTASPAPRTAPSKRDPHARAALACGGLIAIALLLATLGRHDAPARTVDATTVVSAVELRFTDLADGTVVALDAATGAELDRAAPGHGGFVRVTMRSFAAERTARGFGSEEPFTLARLTDGALVLKDRLTGRTMLLDAFGPSNEGVFEKLLDAATGQRTAENSTSERTTR